MTVGGGAGAELCGPSPHQHHRQPLGSVHAVRGRSTSPPTRPQHPAPRAPCILPASRLPGAVSASRSRSCSLYTSMKEASSRYSHPWSRSFPTDSRI